jgi:hypothetical protein
MLEDANVLETKWQGPQPGAEIEATAAPLGIQEWSLLGAADDLGVRTQRGQWWLPGYDLKGTSRVVLKYLPQGRTSLDIPAQTDNSVDAHAASSKCNFALIKV